MVFHEAKGGTAGQIGPVTEKHSFPGNKYILKYRERLDHFVLRRDGARKRVIGAVQEVGCVQAKAGGVNRYSESQRPGLVPRAHASAGQYDEFVDVW